MSLESKTDAAATEGCAPAAGYVVALTAAKSALDKYAAWHLAVSGSQHDTTERFMGRVRLLGDARTSADDAMTKINAALNPHTAELTRPETKSQNHE